MCLFPYNEGKEQFTALLKILLSFILNSGLVQFIGDYYCL